MFPRIEARRSSAGPQGGLKALTLTPRTLANWFPSDDAGSSLSHYWPS